MKRLITSATAIFLLFLFGCVSTMPRPSLLDVPEVTNQSNSSPQFTATQLNAIPPDSTEGRLYVFVKIPHSELIFVQADSGRYYAAFELEEQTTYQGKQIDYQSYLLRTRVYPKHDLTKNTGLFSRKTLKYKGAAPAYCMLNLKITDKNAPQNSSSLSIPLITRSIRTTMLDISDPAIFFTNIEPEKLWSMLFETSIDKLTISSLNPMLLDPWREINIVFEIYFPKYLSLKNKQVVAGYNLNRNQEPVLEKKQTIEIADTTVNRKVVGMPLQLPEYAGNGIYSLTIYAYIQDKDTKTIETNSISVNKVLQFYSPIPREEKQMEDALNSLKYIIPYPKKLLKQIKKAQTVQEKAELFDAFWRSEQAPYSLQEYYRRIQYAKQRCSGIRTDMGKVVMRFGIPDDFPNQIENWGRGFGYADIQAWIYPGFYPVNSTRYFRFQFKTFIFVSEIGGAFSFGHFGAIGTGPYDPRSVIYDHNTSEFISSQRLRRD